MQFSLLIVIRLHAINKANEILAKLSQLRAMPLCPQDELQG